MNKTVIKLAAVSKDFESRDGKKTRALEDIDLEIKQGEFSVFVGPSGCGKSTLLRIISGLEKSFEGAVELADDLNRREMAFVFQQFALFPWLDIRDNITLGLYSLPLSETEKSHLVAREIKRMGLEKFSRAYPRELSGGMKQRVGIARALAVNPEVIFMDEPFSELDSFTAEVLRQDILKIWQETTKTVVMVTHIVEDAVEMADKIVVMSPRPGKIEKTIINRLPRPRVKRSEGFYQLEDEVKKAVKY